MKRDYYSDIKLAERIIFENTGYLLTMLDKKVDSFTSLKTGANREKQRLQLLEVENVVDPQRSKSLQNPLASLANDLTKPVWNCITRVEPVAASLLPQIGGNQSQQMISAFNYSINRFLERFKCEHQDQASLKLHINFIDRKSQLKSLMKQFIHSKKSRTEDLLQQLFGMLLSSNKAKIRQMDPQKMIQAQRIQLLAVLQIFQKLTIKHAKKSTYMHPQLVAEVCNFVDNIQNHIKNVSGSFSGPVYLNYCLQADTLPLLLHPMLLAIYCWIKKQMYSGVEGRESSEQSNQFFQSSNNSKQPLLQQLMTSNCSNITFINLDGYQTDLNLLLAKYLGKHLQYISFPQQQSAFIQNDPKLKAYFRWRSEMLTKEYLASAKEFQDQASLFQQLYKRLIVVPVKSIHMQQRSNKFLSINGYHSHFISLIMREIIYNQIREFGPSLIIISHANTVNLLPHHLQQLLSQLSILTNMKIIFYNNITHHILLRSSEKESKLVQEQSDTFLAYHKEYFRKKQQWSMPHTGFSLNSTFPLSVDMLERASMFLKICSGTANLSIQGRQTEQKYQNSRLLGYAGSIMRLVCRNHPSLRKYDARFFQFIRMSRIFTNCPQPTPISAYHELILTAAQADLEKIYGCEWFSCEHWKSFSHQYALRLSKQKQSQQSKYFTKLMSKNSKNSTYGLTALQFQIIQNHAPKLITLSHHSQILLSKHKKYQSFPIFVLNHLQNCNSTTLNNYFGLVDCMVQITTLARVTLYPLYFRQNVYNLATYQHFTEFNYHETQTSVILFWPLLYDSKQALLHTFQRTSYHPPITSLLFIAMKSNLSNMIYLEPSNKSYKNIHPRIGCTCYEPFNSNTIYVFGGFYTDLANHLDFQTDVSVIQISNLMHYPTVTFQNIPKTFFLNQKHDNQLFSNVVTGLNNDFVRPRVEYEVYQLDHQNLNIKQQKGEKIHEILLLGGVGQKLTRPFSLLSYMAHLITFSNSNLIKIDRLKLNNVVPVNLARPVKARNATKLPVIKIAQNSRIYSTQTIIHPGALTFTHFQLKYISQDPELDAKYKGRHMSINRRMTYTKCYQLGLDEKPQEFQQKKQDLYTVTVRENNQNETVKWILRHYSFEAKNQANVLLTLQNKKNLLTLRFNLEDNAAYKFQKLQGGKLKLAPHHIVAADIHFTQLFVLFFHPEFTEGRTVLARSHSKSVSQIIETQVRQLILSEIYSFDTAPSQLVLKAISSEQVGLLHGFHFSSKVYEQYIIKRVGSYFTRLHVQNSGNNQKIQQVISIYQHIHRPNKKSFIFSQGHKVICLSFLTLERLDRTYEKMLVIVQQLLCSGQSARWKVKSWSQIKFQLQFSQEMISGQQNKPIWIQILDVYATLVSKDTFIVLSCQNFIFQGSINLQNFTKTSMLLFQPVKTDNYHIPVEGKFVLRQNYENERMRDRSGGFHIYAKSIDKGRMLGQKQIQSISDPISPLFTP